jgi:hypothetical protein
VIPGDGIRIVMMSIRPRPESFSKRVTDGFCKKRTRMSRQELFKSVDMDGSNNGKKMGVFTNGSHSIDVKELIGRRTRKREIS